PEQANFVASFFQTPKADKADRSVTNDATGLDQNDPSGFSKLLGGGRVDSTSKLNSVARKDSQSSRVAASDRADRSGQSEQKDASSTSQPSASVAGSTASQKPVENPSRKDASFRDSLHADQLPSDPRLQDPTELALEAAAAAAVAALSLGAQALGESAASLTTATPSSSPITDAALLAFQDKFRASGLASVGGNNSNATLGKNVQPAVAGQPARPQAAAPVQVAIAPQASAQAANDAATTTLLPQFLPSADQGSVTIQISPLLLDAVAKQSRAHFSAEQNQTALQALNGTASQETEAQSSVLAAQGALAAPVEIAAPLDASITSVARLVVPVVKELPRTSVPFATQQTSKANISTAASSAALPNSQLQSAAVSQAGQPLVNAMSPLTQGVAAQQDLPLTNAVGEFFAAAQEAARNAPKVASSKQGVAVSSDKAVVSGQSEIALVAPVLSQPAGEHASNGGQSSFQGQSNAQQAQPQRGAPTSDSSPESVVPAPEAKHGTLGANGTSVARENTANQEQSTVETALVSSGETSSLGVDRSLSDTPVSVPVHLHTPEVKSKPTVLPPVQVKAGEVWRTVQDAVQRARSENPNHLSVEVRLEDGSSLGVELRMSSAGLQASFRSESQTLLKSIEAQWNGFVAKETADLKVVNASFEGNSNFGAGNFSENGTSGGDRRQQMENNAASASLSRDFRAPASSEAAKSFPVVDTTASSQPSVEFLYA
ncbi:MAG: hypothetical protein EBR81_02180, partial [Proteobacteria bacterium]|nr:hypothetical protein [Pseudomonadota bacterium]